MVEFTNSNDNEREYSDTAVVVGQLDPTPVETVGQLIERVALVTYDMIKACVRRWRWPLEGGPQRRNTQHSQPIALPRTKQAVSLELPHS